MIFDVLALLLLLGCVLSSNSVLSRFDERFAKYYIGWQLPLWCSSLTGILILLLLLNPTGFLSKLLGNKVFVFLGKISFGIYLIHFFLIPYVSLGSAYKNFIILEPSDNVSKPEGYSSFSYDFGGNTVTAYHVTENDEVIEGDKD